MVTRPFVQSLSTLVAVGLGLAGCGDSLVGTEYLGEPLLTVTGAVSVLDSGRLGDQQECLNARQVCARRGGDREECFVFFNECLEGQAADASPWELPDNDLRVALFWSRTSDDNTGLEQAVETTGGFPAQYELTIYRHPSSGALREDDRGQFGLAVVLVYLDQDGDGQWDGEIDRIVGGAAPAAVLYTAEGWGRFEPGFHQVQVPHGCSEHGLSPVADEEASVHLRLSVAPTHLDGLLPDVDCDRSTIDWPMCPEREAMLVECRTPGARPPDPWRCTLCAGVPPNGGQQSRGGAGGGGRAGPGGGGGPPPPEFQ
jgi:hypothetical protein